MLLDLNSAYKITRKIIEKSEATKREINKISHPQLKDKLLEALKTCQTDLLIFSDILNGAMECKTENELLSYLDLNDSLSVEKGL